MADEQPGGEVLTSTINRSWLVKMVIFTVVLLGFGLWGLYDAMVAYPARGHAHAEYAQWQYLDGAKLAGKINATSEGGDPRARLDELEAKVPRSGLEQLEHEWLTALSRVGRLNESETKIASPNQTLDTLNAKWKSQLKKPLPLTAYDLPLQWSFVVVGFGGGLMVLMNIIKSRARKYRWEPAAHALTLDDGRRITPDMLADVDKRKWHKYFCTLVFSDGSPSAECDLLKYQGLEDWVLEMEKVRFPERAAEAEAAAAAEAAAQEEDEPPSEREQKSA